MQETAQPLKVEVARALVLGELTRAEAVPVPVKLARAEVVRASTVAQGSPCLPACSKGAQAKRLLAQ